MSTGRAAGIRVKVRRSQNLTDEYMITPNALFRGEGVYAGLSEYARLWLGAGLSCSSDYDTTLATIQEWMPSLGRDRHEAVRRELRERGFLTMSRERIPVGHPQQGRFVWTFEFHMDPLPPQDRDELQPKTAKPPKKRTRRTSPADIDVPMPGTPGHGDELVQVDEMPAGSMPGSSGHGRSGHGRSGTEDQGDVYKEEKNRSIKEDPPPPPEAESKADPLQDREGEDQRFDRPTREMLTAAVAQVLVLQPGWRADAIRAAMLAEVNAGRSPAAVAAAVVLVAADPATISPGRLKHDGPWWAAAAPKPAVAVDRRRGPRCPVQGHERQPAGGCLLCAGEAKGVPDPELPGPRGRGAVMASRP